VEFRIPFQPLVADLVGNECFEVKIVCVCVTLKRFGVDYQQVVLCRNSAAVLRSAALAFFMAILHLTDEAESVPDLDYSPDSGTAY